MTAGNEDGSDEGSDSEPSGDNLGEEELVQIMNDDVDPSQAQKLQMIKKLEASNNNQKLKQKADILKSRVGHSRSKLTFGH